MSVKILVDTDCSLLQEIRLVQALSEGTSRIVIPSYLKDRFINLRKYLKMRYEIGSKGELHLSDYISISHPKPLTCFGGISRPLVFPLAMVKKCVQKWGKSRSQRYTFTGIMSEHREKTLNEWVNKNFSVTNCRDAINVVTAKNIFYSMASLFKPTNKKIISDLTICLSDRGRKFPIKSWDNDYYKLLSKSQFVLCPSGDFIWTYRFFESILCGAIPIVEDVCPTMDGFKFMHVNDNANSLIWNSDVAEHNLDNLIRNYTFKKGEVDFEIEKISRSLYKKERQHN